MVAELCMLISKRCYIVDESEKTRLLIEMVQNSSTVSSFQLSEFSEKKKAVENEKQFETT